MTLRELVENSKGRIAKVDFIPIVNNDYRRCKPMEKQRFVSLYQGRDVWNDEVKDYSVSNLTGGVFTVLEVKL